MTTITIRSEVVDDENFVNLDVVDLDGEKYFFIYGYRSGKRFSDKHAIAESNYATENALSCFYGYLDFQVKK